eukprot:171315_1
MVFHGDFVEHLHLHYHLHHHHQHHQHLHLFNVHIIHLNSIINQFVIDYETCDEYECKGKNEMIVEFNFWVSTKVNKTWLLLTDEILTSLNNEYKIVSLRCPAGQCCNNPNGCNYYESWKAMTLCANGRNLSSITCSSCDANLYELLGSSECGRCIKSNYFYICILFVLSLLFTIGMVFIFSKPTTLFQEMQTNKEMNWRRLLNQMNWRRCQEMQTNKEMNWRRLLNQMNWRRCQEMQTNK